MQRIRDEYDNRLYDFAKKMGREGRIPFEVSIDPFYSKENLAHLRRSIASLESGRGVAHELVDDGE